MLTNVGQRVGHQSWQDGSAARQSAVFLNGIPLRVDFVFSQVGAIGNC